MFSIRKHDRGTLRTNRSPLMRTSTRCFALAVCLALSAAAAPVAASEKKKGGGRTYLQLPPLAATVIGPDGRRGVLTVETGVHAKSEAVHARAQASLPRLRAAYVTAIQSHAQGLPPGGAPHADRLAAALQKETDRVLGGPGAKLLLGSIMIN
jgi:hypothetical protein